MTNDSSIGSEPERKIILLLGLFVAAVCIHLAWITYQRVIFPWDLYIWSESPFLTNMIKLTQGFGIYTDPADANSFVYSPGLEWLAYLALNPWDLALDIRFIRLVSIVLGLLACIASGVCIARLDPRSQTRTDRMLVALVSGGLFALVLFKNVTSDLTHPDNLHLFHAAITFWLGYTALELDSKKFAVLAILWAGLGVLTKQTEALAFVGLMLAFVLRTNWPTRTKIALFVTGIIATLISLAILWAPEWSRFYTLEVMSRHPLEPRRMAVLIPTAKDGYRWLLLAAAVPSLIYLWKHSSAGKNYVAVWLGTAIFCSAPNLTAFLKELGMINNLGILNYWLALAVWPALIMVARDFSANVSTILRSSALLTALLLAGLLITEHVPPSENDYAFARELDQRLKSDFESGCRVMVDNNTSAWLHAGYTEVPRDRINTIINLKLGGLGDMTQTYSRLQAGYYDRLYLLWPDPSWLSVLEPNYILEESIPSQGFRSMRRGFMGMMQAGAKVWTRKQPRAEAPDCIQGKAGLD